MAVRETTPISHQLLLQVSGAKNPVTNSNAPIAANIKPRLKRCVLSARPKNDKANSSPLITIAELVKSKLSGEYAVTINPTSRFVMSKIKAMIMILFIMIQVFRFSSYYILLR